MNTLKIFAIILLVAINLVGFVIVGVDKWKAVRKKWRIAERTFFILALLGASPGVYSGCLIFRHKTKHGRFMLGIPVILCLQAVLAWAILKLY